MQLIDRHALLKNVYDNPPEKARMTHAEWCRKCIYEAPTIKAEPVRHGRWIECDYKHMEHGMIETEPKAGLCCSECRTGFKKNRMTYKAFCPACGTRMDATDTNVGGKGGLVMADLIIDVYQGSNRKCLVIGNENHWIPCSERLPEKHTEVLAYSPFWGKIVVALWGGEYWLEQWTDDDLQSSEITHWMPLPEIPEPPEMDATDTNVGGKVGADNG